MAESDTFEYEILSDSDADLVEHHICPECEVENVTSDTPFVETIDGRLYSLTAYDCMSCGARYARVDGRIDEFGKPLAILGDSLIGRFLRIE